MLKGEIVQRYFNTSGPNIPTEHYTLKRKDLIEKGVILAKKRRYFTIWAPRQTGKSTYFRLLAKALEKTGYKVTHINVENFLDASKEFYVDYLSRELKKGCGINVRAKNFSEFQDSIKNITSGKCVLIIDEIEGLNPEIFGQFLHTIRNLYHFRDEHCLKSVILVGVSNIIGVIQDHASPFNIADNLPVPYFTKQEVFELLEMHENETGQLFNHKVKEKIAYITACQPGLVNGFAYKLVEDHPDKKIIDYDDYLKVEDWYLRLVIDKNIANVINKAKKYRPFVESLLFSQNDVKFDIEREAIKILHTNGVLKDENGYVKFWVPLYKKKLYSAFYPFANGEDGLFFRNFSFKELYKKDGTLNFDILIDNYKDYVKKRSFKYFREKDKTTGKYLNIKESALAYSFETYIQTLVQTVEGKSYLEPHTGLGRCDLIINVNNKESVIEFKIYRDIMRFEKGKKQLAYYANGISVNNAVYLVFVPNTVTLPDIKEEEKEINGVLINTYIIRYDEEKDF